MFYLFVFLVLTLGAEPALAGAWTAPERHWEFYYNLNIYGTDHYYDNGGHRQSQDSYTKVEDSFRLEYGLRDGMTIGGSIELASVRGTAQIGTIVTPTLPPQTTNIYATGWNYGVADPRLYLRQRLWQDDSSVISAQATTKFPSYFSNEQLPQSGSDKISQEVRLLAGTNFDWLEKSHFADVEAAYEYRPGQDADFLHADATLGLKFLDSVMLMPQLFSTWRLGGDNGAYTQSGNDSYDLVKGQLSAIVPVTDSVSLQASAFNHLYARNTGGGSGLTLGVWYKP